jgi:bifunctional non-homologous end joining protein LigD
VEDLGHPDRCVLGLAPGRGVPWEAVVRAAQDLREYLARAGLTCFLKTAAAGGLHVVVPLCAGPDWSRLRAFSRRVAEGFARLRPECSAAAAAGGPRPGTILIDAPRKEEGSASVAPYSAFAEGRGIVSAPLAWDECTPRLRPESFTLRNLPDRLRRRRVDPWAGISEIRQAIPPGI